MGPQADSLPFHISSMEVECIHRWSYHPRSLSKSRCEECCCISRKILTPKSYSHLLGKASSVCLPVFYWKTNSKQPLLHYSSEYQCLSSWVLKIQKQVLPLSLSLMLIHFSIFCMNFPIPWMTQLNHQQFLAINLAIGSFWRFLFTFPHQLPNSQKHL